MQASMSRISCCHTQHASSQPAHSTQCNQSTTLANSSSSTNTATTSSSDSDSNGGSSSSTAHHDALYMFLPQRDATHHASNVRVLAHASLQRVCINQLHLIAAA